MPIIGPIYRDLISGHDLIAYIAFAMVPVTYWALLQHALRPASARGRREPGRGRHRRHFGARPALSARCVICGVLVGFAGAYLVARPGRLFPAAHERAGKGFIALAALVFAKWRPWPALGDLPAVRLSRRGGDPAAGGGSCRSSAQVPVQAIQALPYILTVVLLAGFIGKAIPPQGVGDALCQGALRAALPELFAAAKAAQANAYAPYSRFQVGAALRTPDGRDLCRLQRRERRLSARVLRGGGAIAAMALGGRAAHRAKSSSSATARRLCTPCGGCRQRIREFADPSTAIHIAGPKACGGPSRSPSCCPIRSARVICPRVTERNRRR